MTVLLLPLWCAAVEPYVPQRIDPVLEPWRWREAEALADLGVLCMDEAADGTLWFGCRGGLVRYNGLEVEQIRFEEDLVSGVARDPNREPWAKSVLCTRDGRLLVVVESGLVRRSDGLWKIMQANVGQSVFETRLAQANDGSVWLLMADALWHFSEDLSTQRVVLRAPGNQRLTSFCFDEEGGVWVVRTASPQATTLLHIPLEDGRPRPEQAWRRYPVELGEPGRETAVCAGPDGRIWYVDNQMRDGLLAFDPRTASWDRTDNPDRKRGFFSLMRDRYGTVWAGGTSGLFAVRERQGAYYSAAQLGLPSIPLSVHETSSGRWWVIGRVGHVYTMDPGKAQWLTYNRLHFECESDDGTQWFLAPAHRVVSHDPATGQWLKYGPEDGMIGHPRSLFASSHGLVWATGSDGERAALSIYDGERWTRHDHPDFALMIGQGSVFEAADRTVWFGAMGDQTHFPSGAGGALRYEVTADGQARLLEHRSTPGFPYAISRIAQTPDETLWLGSPTIYRYQGGSPAAQVVPELPGVFTYDLALDGNQGLWTAKGFGVYRKEPDGWRQYGMKDGLAGELIVDLLPLQDGTLLAASEKGISRFDGRTWAGQVLAEDFGMSSRGGHMRRSSDGAVWFNFTKRDRRSLRTILNLGGGQNCTVRYVADTRPPDTAIAAHLGEVDASGNTHISWSGRDPWGNTPTDRLHYSWRLDRGEWSVFSRATGRAFLDLPSGEHTLEVRARDRDFNVDPTPALTAFTVIPPVWRRPWFAGMVTGFSAMIIFLTWVIIRSRERHLIELQADREAHLLEVDRLKTGFFTNVSHEMRTPLTVILGPLEKMLATEKDAQKRRVLTMMVRNANRMATLVTQLLDFRRMEQGRLRIEATEGDIVQHVEDIVASLQPMAEHGGIACRLERTHPCTGWFDPDKLEKVLANLVSNAIKYTPAGGRVEIGLKVEPDQEGRRVLELKVEDTGTGIDPDHLAHIFDRFYRISEVSRIDGSGIGLHLAKDLVDLWGGELFAESPMHDDPEHPGTRFTVRLPIDRKGLPQEVVALPPMRDETLVGEDIPTDHGAVSVAASSRADVPHPADEVPVLLVVDDDADLREFVASNLESPYRIEEAADGAEGLERARALVPDLVVTDVMMPVMDGMALCRELKQAPETSHIPVIMLTSKSSLDSEVEGFETGADDYVTKPFHMVLLETRIRNLLESRRLLRERLSLRLAQATDAEAVKVLALPEPSVAEQAPQESTLDQAFWETVCRILEENCSDAEFHTESLASALHMSQRSLQRKIKALADRTPVQLIGEFRVKKAAVLLRQTPSNVTDIAFEAGFGDLSHFYRLFRKTYGMNPTQYREEHADNPNPGS